MQTRHTNQNKTLNTAKSKVYGLLPARRLCHVTWHSVYLVWPHCCGSRIFHVQKFSVLAFDRLSYSWYFRTFTAYKILFMVFLLKDASHWMDGSSEGCWLSAARVVTLTCFLSIDPFPVVVDIYSFVIRNMWYFHVSLGTILTGKLRKLTRLRRKKRNLPRHPDIQTQMFQSPMVCIVYLA